MICESVRELLGGELAAQVEAVLRSQGAGDMELVVGNDGSFLSIAAHEEALEGLRREGELTAALRGLVHDPADVLPLLGEIGEDGLEAALAPLRASKPYLFCETAGIAGARPAPVGAAGITGEADPFLAGFEGGYR